MDCKCPHCGSSDFHVHEFELWKASVNPDSPSRIDCFHKSSGIDLIECAVCGADVTELSVNPEIEFNFQ